VLCFEDAPRPTPESGELLGFWPNSAKLLDRFCDGDTELRKHVEDALRREQRAIRIPYTRRLSIFRIAMREM